MFPCQKFLAFPDMLREGYSGLVVSGYRIHNACKIVCCVTRLARLQRNGQAAASYERPSPISLRQLITVKSTQKRLQGCNSGKRHRYQNVQKGMLLMQTRSGSCQISMRWPTILFLRCQFKAVSLWVNSCCIKTTIGVCHESYLLVVA